MTVDFRTPSIFGSNNARHKSPEEVALSFVPPSDIFEELSSKNNHIVIGPRGSGKTTLLKMLTLPALGTWPSDDNVTVLPKCNFVGIFVPADNGWSVQINQATDNAIDVGAVAFTTHVLMAFIQSLLDLQNTDIRAKGAIVDLPAELKPAEEVSLIQLLSKAWHLTPELQNLKGLKLALRRRLLELEFLKKPISSDPEAMERLSTAQPYLGLNFKTCLSYGIDCYEAVSSKPAYSWAVLFDEFEIAPKRIQEEVLRDMRGQEDGRILYKVALAPFNESFLSKFEDYSTTPTNDYNVVSLWYSDKRKASEFSKDLLTKLLADVEIRGKSLSSMLGVSAFAEDETSYGPEGAMTKVLLRLAKADASFAMHFAEQKIGGKLQGWSTLTESQKASIRKLRAVATVREALIREGAVDGSDTVKLRSRKRHNLYAGVPSILELCEGNPRTIISLFTPIVRELKRLEAATSNPKLSPSFQSERISQQVNSFRSLLRTIEYEDGVSLLQLLDIIGNYFEAQIVGPKFNSEPNLTFVVPENVGSSVINAIGKALNAGAVIYVADTRDADPVLTSVIGKRFRLNYLLSTYYNLPIILNSAVSLSKILDARKVSATLNLFSEEASE